MLYEIGASFFLPYHHLVFCIQTEPPALYMAPHSTYQLQIIRASGLPSADGSSEAPNPYVEISVGDARQFTRVVKVNSSPVWDETFELSTVDLTAIISIRVMHESFLHDQCLGGVHVSVENLLGMNKTQDQDITLKLRPQINDETPMNLADIGSIDICLSVKDTPSTIEETITKPSQSTQVASTLHEIDVTDDVLADLSFLSNDTMKQLAHWFSTWIEMDISPEMWKYLIAGNHQLLWQSAELQDIVPFDQRIMLYKAALRLAGLKDPIRPEILGNLGVAFLEHFQQYGQIAHLEDAISNLEEAVHIAPEDHSNWLMYLNNLGISFGARFKQLGDIVDLNKAILHQQQVVDTAPESFSSLPMCHNNLGNSFQTRFEQLRDKSDLNKAILYYQQAILATPKNDPDLPKYLNNIGAAFKTCFKNLGDIADLDKAILHQQQAILTTPEAHPDQSTYHNEIGISLRMRFEHLEDIVDLSNAITHFQQAIHLASEDPALPMSRYLNNLGTAFLTCFEQEGDVSYLNDAILHQQHAIDIKSEDNFELSGYFNNLGCLFQRRYEQLRDISDLNKAVLHYQQACKMIPDRHPDLPACLHNLGSSLHLHFKEQGDIADLNKAILYQQQAVQLTDSHLHLLHRLHNLGSSLQTRFEHHRDDADLKDAILKFSMAAQSPGKSYQHFAAALKWVDCMDSLSEESSLKAYACILELLPQLAWLGQSIHTRYDVLTKAKSVVCDAAAISLNTFNTTQALEWLEAGRSIVWGQIMQLRTPLDTLQESHPTLAKKLSDLSSILQNEESVTVEQRHIAAQEQEELIKEVRNIQGFEQFLLPTAYSELKQVSCLGTVIVVNISRHRCDALIIKSPVEPLLHIPLSSFSYEQAQNLQLRLKMTLTKLELLSRGDNISIRSGSLVKILDANEEFRYILAELWIKIVKPILDGLAIIPSPMNSLPRIWWCPTGPLVFLPLHAAGIYPAKQGEFQICLLDFAISSYAPTLTALAASQESFKKKKDNTSLLAVIQSNVPHEPPLPSLPGTEKELKIIRHFSEKHQILTVLDGEEAKVEKVLSKMGECSWVHFACHGKQDSNKPIKSGFLLQDGCLELSKIVQKALPNAEFAFLSACQTATGDEIRPDETIHLAAGMLVAGYQSVIATMWSIGDDDAPLIADSVYSHLLGSKLHNSQETAYALHTAVQTLRNCSSFASWVPFIHMGV